ncbi:hypothetical protein J2T57_001788 [Natronocella acetinitrilica]|uniref:Outer membrane protein beta-barrel domain-containing protein n=1 Tax=Natronocella acetinitrilica TaxID=414046 RepID=A0AAE3G2J6_9GAMM|nr:outer membrane beta-barrel protein [Natronocella acetinitrilica]MCP1674650.1 hypothetical protein [Natronocella acetinitrilica]
MTRRSHSLPTSLALTLALLVAAPGMASATGLYGGIGGIYTDFDDVDNDSRFGYRLYGGYDFIRIPALLRLGLEGGYTRTGSFEDGDGNTDRLSNGDAGLQVTLTTLPLVNFHGRAGYEWGDTEGAMFALGGSVSVFPLTRIRAEYQNRNEFDAGMLSLEIRLP